MTTENEKQYIQLTKLLKGKVEILQTIWDDNKHMSLCVASEDESKTKELVTDPLLLKLVCFKPIAIAEGCIRYSSRVSSLRLNLTTGESYPNPTIFVLEDPGQSD